MPRPAILVLLVTLAATVGAADIDAASPRNAAQVPAVPPPVVADSMDSAPAMQPPPDTLEPISAQRADIDERTRSELQALFDRVPSFKRLTVHVDAGVVRLEGVVVDAETRRRAVELAASMDDVRFVDTRIRESTSLDEQLQPTWAKLRALGLGTVAKLPLFAVAILIIALAITAGSLLARWRGPTALQVRNPFLQGVIGRALQLLLVLLGLVLALDLLGATALVSAVVGTAGLAGLAIGLAFKDIAENYLAGTLLALRQPFAQNDQIRMGEFEGKVVRLTPRETILMTADGNHVRLPNAMIFRSPLVNFTRNPLRRFVFEAGVGTGDDLVLARDVGVAALLATDGVLRDPPPQVLVTALGDSSITMSFAGWLDQHRTEYLRVRSEAIRMVKAHLEEAGVSMPSPEYSVAMRSALSSSIALPEERRSPPTPGERTRSASDVSVDRTLDQQIEAERRQARESDLLEAPSAPADVTPSGPRPAAPPPPA